MKILSIETSCDETGVSIVEIHGELPNATFTVHGDALLSQAEKHAEFGGVFPSLAKREHAKNAVPLLIAALKEASQLSLADKPAVTKEKLDEIRTLLEREPELFAQLIMFFAQYKKPNIDAIAVTNGPGLEPALWVGVNFAKALSLAWDIPIVPVNHMEGHIVSALVERADNNFKFEILNFKFPAIALLVSGGHTELVLMKDWFKYELIGATRDDAAGEAFDKSARLLGIPYPGGPEVSRLAALSRKQAKTNPEAYSQILKNLRISEKEMILPRPMIYSDNYDFSFSGLKTAVLRLVEKLSRPEHVPKPHRKESRFGSSVKTSKFPLHDGSFSSTYLDMPPRNIHRSLGNLKLLFRRGFSEQALAEMASRPAEHASGKHLDEKIKAYIAREVEDAIVDILVTKTKKALDEYGAYTLVVSGGVSANAELRRRMTSECADVAVHFPPKNLSTDNALMIGLAGSLRFLKGETAPHDQIRAQGNLSLAE